MEVFMTFLKAFLVGGFICMIGQLLLNLTNMTAGKILVIFLLVGVFLQAIGLYQYVVDFGSSGATVPIVGFGYVLAKGAMEGAKISIFEALTGGFKAGAFGIVSAIVFGYINALIFKPKTKIK